MRARSWRRVDYRAPHGKATAPMTDAKKDTTRVNTDETVVTFENDTQLESEVRTNHTDTNVVRFDIKQRWRGVKGLDAEIDCVATPPTAELPQ